MSSVFDALMTNLEKQLRAMVEDNLEEVVFLANAQEGLAQQLNERLASGEPVSPEDGQKLRRIADLLSSNHLLAQQSLAFSRRMMRLLSGEEGYNLEGLTTGKPRGRLDTRA
jgi:hypothetical protein